MNLYAYKINNLSDLERKELDKSNIKRVVSSYLNVDLSEIKFKKNKYGKPLLMLPDKEIGFNLSHSGNWTVLAVDNNAIVGVDIEKKRLIDLSVIKECLTEEEINYLDKKKNRLEEFYKIWTLKESFIKAIGKGLSYSLKDFYFDFSDGGIKLFKKNKKKQSNWYFKNYTFKRGYILSVCSSRDNFPEDIKYLDCKYE